LDLATNSFILPTAPTADTSTKVNAESLLNTFNEIKNSPIFSGIT
jgi:hypothetical protein